MTAALPAPMTKAEKQKLVDEIVAKLVYPLPGKESVPYELFDQNIMPMRTWNSNGPYRVIDYSQDMRRRQIFCFHTRLLKTGRCAECHRPEVA